MKYLAIFCLSCSISLAQAQEDTLVMRPAHDTLGISPIPPLNEYRYLDTALRIVNLNPYFTIHVDSILNYDLRINRDSKNYFWFLTNSPVGVRIERTTGNLYFKADKAYFRSGRLKYDEPYKVQLGVQNLYNPNDRVDTSFTILFYSTEINASKLKPTAASIINVEEGDSIAFKILCEDGTFPIEQISLNTSMAISNFTPVRRCGDEFRWNIPFAYFRDGDTARQRTVLLEFVGSDKFYNKDTVVIRVNIRPGINYPVRNQQHKQASEALYRHMQELKINFAVLSRNIKKNRDTRTAFDISGSTTAFAGTVASTTSDPNTTGAKIGRILPSVGLTLVPVKEAVAPNRVQQQNTATQVRSEVKRLDFVLQENRLNGERDPEVMAKTKRLQDELKKSKLQFVDLDFVEFDSNISEAEADRIFNDPKVNKKYRLKYK